jgi:hypothetical protein
MAPGEKDSQAEKLDNNMREPEGHGREINRD